MTFRVVYQRFSDIKQGVILVEELIDAARFNVKDGGNLLLYDDTGPVMAIPTKVWMLNEPAPPEKSRLAL